MFVFFLIAQANMIILATKSPEEVKTMLKINENLNNILELYDSLNYTIQSTRNS